MIRPALLFLKKWLLRTLLAWLVFTVVSVLWLRFLPPPTTAFLVADHLSRWTDEKKRPAQHHQWISADDIPKNMLLAVVAAEDQKFPDHLGFDVDAILRAAEHNQSSRRVRGGSTISQQLAKNLFLWSGRSYVRKGLEVWFTAWMELLIPKERLLVLYVNVVEFGDGVFGVGAAANIYFKKAPSKLSRRDCALLAAVLPNPKRYLVRRPSAYVLERRRWIEIQMQRLGSNYLSAM